MTIEDITAKHVSDEKRLCYAQSLGPVTALHQFSNRVNTAVLRCTQPLGHDGDHKDGNCCWTPHRFGRELAGPPEPEWHNFERCVACGRKWPCDVERIRLLTDATLVEATTP